MSSSYVLFKYVLFKGANDFNYIFFSEGQIRAFLAGMGVTSSGDDDIVVLEGCLPLERITLSVSSRPPRHTSTSTPSSETRGFFFPLSAFFVEILKALNVAPSQLFPNI